jgi:hypothetical protein
MRSSMPSREARGISRQGASELLKSVPVDSYVAKDEADAMRVKRAIEDAGGRPKWSGRLLSRVPRFQAGQVGEGAVGFTYSGRKYLLGWGEDFLGIWDRRSPGPPVHRSERTPKGWRGQHGNRPRPGPAAGRS